MPRDRYVSIAPEHEWIAALTSSEQKTAVEEYFTKCKVNIIPLRFGSGMKVKTINGLCRGIPMVSTSIGTEGLQVEHNKDILISDDVKQFGVYVAELLQDKAKWTRLAQASKITAAKFYTWDSLYKILDENI